MGHNTQKQLDYTSLDFYTIKDDLISKLKEENNFKDYNFEGSNINTLVDIVSAVGGLFGYYINAIANESFVSSAKLYESLNKLAELVGYKPDGKKSATTTATVQTLSGFSLSGKDGYVLRIPRFSTFTSTEKSPQGDEIVFTNPNEINHLINTTLTPVTLDFDIPLVQGIPLKEGEELSFISDGTEFQKYVIPDPNAIEEEMLVTVNGVEWTRIGNFLEIEDPEEKVYTTRYNKDKKIEVKFSDGSMASKPGINDSVKIRYISSLGENGNTSSNLVTVFNDKLYLVDLAGISTEVNSQYYIINHNYTSEGGMEPETVEDLREKIPAFTKTQNRLVTKEDYKNLLTSNFNEFIYDVKALNYSEVFGLSAAQKLGDMLTASEEYALSAALSAALISYEIQNLLQSPIQSSRSIYYNNVYLVVIPKFGNTITRELKLELDKFIDEHKMITYNHVYLEPQYYNIDVDITYTKLSTTSRLNNEIESDIRTIINDYFSKSNRHLGDFINLSEIMNSIYAIKGIRSAIITLNGLNNDIDLPDLAFPILNTLTIQKV